MANDQLATSPKITGSGSSTRICYRFSIEAATELAAIQAALNLVPSGTIIVQGVELTRIQLQSACAASPRQKDGLRCWTVEVCKIADDAPDRICSPEDFELSFEIGTVTERVFTAIDSKCWTTDPISGNVSSSTIPVRQLETVNPDGTVELGCEIEIQTTQQCLTLCYEPGFLNNEWWRTLKNAIAGTCNSEPIVFPIAGGSSWTADPGEALLTSVSGQATLNDPFIIQYCWQINCNKLIPILLGRPASQVICENGAAVCQITPPDIINVPKGGWEKISWKTEDYIPCEERIEGGGTLPCVPGSNGEFTSYAKPKRPFITDVYVDPVYEKFDHTSLFPPQFQP